jgi:adenylate kinase
VGFSYNFLIVEDQIVIDLVNKEIEACEQEKMSWVIQGFPRTKVQALSLQKIKVIPDKFIQLQTKQVNSLARLKNKLIQINQSLYGNELDDLAAQCLLEHELNQRGVNAIFNQFIFEMDCDQFSA